MEVYSVHVEDMGHIRHVEQEQNPTDVAALGNTIRDRQHFGHLAIGSDSLCSIADEEANPRQSRTMCEVVQERRRGRLCRRQPTYPRKE